MRAWLVKTQIFRQTLNLLKYSIACDMSWVNVMRCMKRDIRVSHKIGIVIADEVIIGKNVWLRQGVTLGSRHKKYPIIKDNVYVGSNAIIIGGITIGNNSIVGAGAVVMQDVPDNYIAVGNPARVLPKKEGRDYSSHRI